jgi:catechol 2,3-dioxygenase
VRTLAELALRVDDLDTMVRFYTEIVGLDIYSDRAPEYVFLKVADLVPGHPQILGLFDREFDPAPERTRLDHFAFLVERDELDAERSRLEALGVTLVPREFPDYGWRSIFFTDPEGNVVEFVATQSSP